MRELRKFGFNLGLGLNILGCIMFYRGKAHFIYFTTIGSLGLLFAIIWPAGLILLKKILDFVIHTIGRIINFICLTIAFYLIFTPIGLLLRLLRRDLLGQKIDKKKESYWLNRPKTTPNYERMG